jgi:hypothetical protein
MFVPAPIRKDFVPYAMRPRLRRNAGLFVDAAGGGTGRTSRAAPQAAYRNDCQRTAPDGSCRTPCDFDFAGRPYYCVSNECTADTAKCISLYGPNFATRPRLRS